MSKFRPMPKPNYSLERYLKKEDKRREKTEADRQKKLQKKYAIKTPQQVQKLFAKQEFQSLEKELDRVFSLWVRQRDTDQMGVVRCCTCGTPHHWRKMDCGHFMSRKHRSTRFEEKNTGPQCKHCNLRCEGMHYEFSQHLDDKYGQGTAANMQLKSRLPQKRTAFEYQYLIKEYTEKLISKGFAIR